jgi:hypothetical protein
MIIENQIVRIAAIAVDEVENGLVNPLEVYTMLSEAKDELTKAIDQLKPIVENEILKGNREYGNYSYKIQQGRRMLDFSVCPEWLVIDQKKKQVEEKLKALTRSGMDSVVDADTGEVITLPIVNFAKDSIVRTKK